MVIGSNQPEGCRSVQRTSKGKDGKQVAKRATAELSLADTARADHYARASRADNTWKAYQAAFAQFIVADPRITPTATAQP
jgi:hypothetical protein